MFEKFFDRVSVISLILIFFICALIYNVGYFSVLGGSLRYFFNVPITFLDVVNSGLWVGIILGIILFVFKPVLVNPAFAKIFPNATILLIMAVSVLLSNFLYFAIFSDSQNRMLALFFEVTFYGFAMLCFITLIYYFLDTNVPLAPFFVFVLSLVLLSYLIGVVDAKVAMNSDDQFSKSQILLKNDRVINANIVRSGGQGIFIKTDKAQRVDFISWDEIKGVKFR